jgi:hypothetical protein
LSFDRESEESSSFLKKRTRKLLRGWLSLSGTAEAKIDKSFLLLFFKKGRPFSPSVFLRARLTVGP